ncbi:MAG: putative serine/threonine protein phosphatase, partial [Ilumatobacteraceae bacterium]|nr:putative serine/threonine protein phosphatase [Ilumatobacteraceae bacterium]
MAELRWGAFTDAGRIREENEDTYVAEPLVFVVADGMGGHQAGEVASALASTILRERLSGGASSVDVVVAAVLEANAAIFQTAHNNVAQRGMGTTLVALAVLPANDEHPEQLALVNVGDSRVYLMRGGELTRATVDHSYVQELLATGHITEAEARNHPRRNIVTRALGIEPNVRVDSWLLPMVRGDRFVLCSDGLVDEVDDEDIFDLLVGHEAPQAAAEALVAAAIEAGGRDNVTVLVVDVAEGIEPDDLAAMIEDADATV